MECDDKKLKHIHSLKFMMMCLLSKGNLVSCNATRKQERRRFQKVEIGGKDEQYILQWESRLLKAGDKINITIGKN